MLLARELAPRLADELAARIPAPPDAPSPKRLLTLDELVAELPAGKRPATWKRWLYERTRRGEIPGCFKIGGSLFFDLEQVRDWLQGGTAGRVAEAQNRLAFSRDGWQDGRRDRASGHPN